MTRSGATRYALTAAVYVTSYAALSEISDRYAVRTGVSVFYLPPGLMLVLLLLGGLRFAPVALLGPCLVGFVVNPLPVSLWQTFVVAVSLTAVYCLAAFLLLRPVRLDLSLQSIRAMGWFVSVAAIAAPMITAAVVVAEFTWFGMVSWRDAGQLALRFWIGDAIGVLAVAPLALVVFAQVRRRRTPAEEPLLRAIPLMNLAEFLLLGLALLATVSVTFTQDTATDLQLLHLSFIPMVWIALRGGVAGSAASIPIVSMLAVELSPGRETAGNVQLFLITLSVTALTLGAVVTERRRSAADVSSQADLLSAVIQSTTDAMYLKRLGDFEYLTVNDQAASALNLPIAAMLGKTDFDLFDDVTARALRTVDESVLASGEPISTEELLPDGEGGERVMLSSKSVCRTADGTVIGLIGVSRDITERKQFEQQLTHQALHDHLTGLPNRALLQDRAQQALSRASRLNTSIAVLFFDIDRFKVVNDSLGHGAGDGMLRQVGERLSELIRDDDTVCRLGGDEFVVLCQDVDGASHAMQLAARLMDVLRQPMPVAATMLTITASVGIVITDRGRTELRDVDALLRDADAAMYSAKAAGRNQAVLFDTDLGTAASNRLSVEVELRDALARNELRIHYQPEVSLVDGRVVGVEALVRWQHPSRGLLSPAEFIDIAEETGLIVEVGAVVLDAAAQQASHWHAHRTSGTPFTTWVNVSARELVDGEFVARVTRTLARHRLPVGAIGLELTESVLIGRERSVVQKLQDLDRLGVQLAIDDFGTGFSSLTYLRRFPVSTMKIDREFVAGLTGENADADDAVITHAVIGMAASLGLSCVAEGVETREQAEWLRRAGCPTAQGYFFGRPCAADDVDMTPRLSTGSVN